MSETTSKIIKTLAKKHKGGDIGLKQWMSYFQAKTLWLQWPKQDIRKYLRNSYEDSDEIYKWCIEQLVLSTVLLLEDA